MEQAVIWILGIIAFIILEAVTYQLVSIWFAIGALGGMIAAFLGTNFYVQMAVFIVVSFICILCLRPLSMKFFKPRNVETNAQSLVGKEVLITSDVDQDMIEIEINDMVNNQFGFSRSDISQIEEFIKVAV